MDNDVFASWPSRTRHDFCCTYLDTCTSFTFTCKCFRDVTVAKYETLHKMYLYIKPAWHPVPDEQRRLNCTESRWRSLVIPSASSSPWSCASSNMAVATGSRVGDAYIRRPRSKSCAQLCTQYGDRLIGSAAVSSGPLRITRFKTMFVTSVSQNYSVIGNLLLIRIR
jgi:hypothetical protein